MHKIKLFGSNKSAYHCNFELEMDQSFLSGFRQLLTELGFDMLTSSIMDFGRPLHDCEVEPDETKEIPVASYVDSHFYFVSGEYKIDVVFGQKKIFLIFYTLSDKQEEISHAVNAFCSF